MVNTPRPITYGNLRQMTEGMEATVGLDGIYFEGDFGSCMIMRSNGNWRFKNPMTNDWALLTKEAGNIIERKYDL